MFKATSFFTILFCLSGLTFAQNQDVSNPQLLISLDYKDAPLWEVFKDISKQTGIGFILDKDIRNLKITLFIKDVTFKDALAAICAAINLKYEIINDKTYSFSCK